MGEKIAFGFLGILLLGALVLCFWLNLYLGLFILIFSIFVFWWIYGVRKRKIDSAMAKVAKDTDLSFHKDFFKYGTLKGKYKGYETEIGVYNDLDAFGGIGTILTSITGSAGFSALNIRNFTGIKMKHNLEIKDRKIISEEFPVIVAQKNEVYLMLPHVSYNPGEIKRNLNKLCKVIDSLPIEGGLK
jgi:hypothetical protein